MRPILSATGTYNYELAKWLDEKLKPLSINRFTITDIFAFATEMKGTKLNEEDILVSFDVSSLFTNVPLDETITILAKKARLPKTGLMKPTLLSFILHYSYKIYIYTFVEVSYKTKQN